MVGMLSSGGSRISQRGGTNPRGRAPTYYLANFFQKLHENEDIVGQRGVHIFQSANAQTWWAGGYKDKRVQGQKGTRAVGANLRGCKGKRVGGHKGTMVGGHKGKRAQGQEDTRTAGCMARRA